MIRFGLVSVAVFHFTILSASALSIGTLSQHLYYPSATGLGPAISFYYSTNCLECLCYARTLPNNSIVAINCLRTPRVCFLYSNYSDNYSFRWNSTGKIYFFQLPLYPPVTLATTRITSQITTNPPTTIRSTSKWTSQWNYRTHMFDLFSHRRREFRGSKTVDREH